MKNLHHFVKIFVVGALFLFCLFPLNGRTQNKAGSGSDSADSMKSSLGLDLGQTILLGGWSKNFDDGLSLGASYGYQASSLFEFLGRWGWVNLSGGGTNHLRIISVEPDLRVNAFQFDSLQVYAFGGFGLYFLKQTEGTASGSSMNFGLNVGGGVDLKITPQFTFGPGMEIKSLMTKKSGGVSTGGDLARLFIQLGYHF